VDVSYLILYILPINILEVLAASFGLYYLKRKESPHFNSKLLVWFLWLTVFVEIVGFYAVLAYLTEYRIFSFIKGTPFQNNIWWYNLYSVVDFIFFTYYFTSFLKSKWMIYFFRILVAIFLGYSVSIFFLTDELFLSSSSSVMIFGSLIVLLSVLSFYYELLRSDLILNLKRFLPIYISIGVLIFNLSVTPLTFFSEYFKLIDGNEMFVMLHMRIMLFANIFMYLTFILGFILCSPRKKFS